MTLVIIELREYLPDFFATLTRSQLHNVKSSIKKLKLVLHCLKNSSTYVSSYITPLQGLCYIRAA